MSSRSGRDVDWRSSYARRLGWSDFLVVAWAVFGAQLLWFGVDSVKVTGTEEITAFTVNYTIFSVALILLWTIALGVGATREYRIVGAGADEYKRVANVSLQVFGLVAIVGFAFQLQFSRGYLLVALPAGVLILLLERWLWRQWLGSVRLLGEYSARCVVVGGTRAVQEIVGTLGRQSAAGYHVLAVCISGAGRTLDLDRRIRVASVDQLKTVMAEVGADTVIMVGGHDLSAREIRELSWSLIPGEQHLVMVPNLIDVAGPRIHTRPVAGLPLVHVETPRYEGAGRFTKRAFDLLGAFVAVILLSPVLLFAALAVKLGSRGPLLFRQERIGLRGETFHMLKFRSMVVDAEARLPELLQERRDAGNEVLFKLKDDPRVTRVGRFMRRYSIDELPQLFNVLGGSMSLVGPRPPLEREVDLYDEAARRRLLVRPGLTGLWQVSGRSTLSWEDSIRLDLYYVENWSLMGDVVLLWRTVKAVFARDGAY
ncbi:sugar transferase [Protaetiibacter intestinalis]|uniref:Sugar transferase n=1 Tax=Protaetiibacter intestinalis TaxID=2419774 RepID=A0A387B8E0_9MICO|nr:sugar transferase [Protaetiibacter intestinalis]AYF97249.1 sugar transferase [Protaetiibacter intestinalis]